VQDLDPYDLLAMRELIRFGALTVSQLERRYRSPEAAHARVSLLLEEGLVAPADPWLPDVEAYQITRRGLSLARFGLKPHNIKPGHLGHDLAVIDLADALTDARPASRWHAEQEIPRALHVAGDGARIDRRKPGHTPDGLLQDGRRWIAVELEHSMKSELSYIDICCWYALEQRIAEIWWFTDNPKIAARIRAVAAEQGYADDTTFKVDDLPPGVLVHERQRP
jgi:hypothetical protein